MGLETRTGKEILKNLDDYMKEEASRMNMRPDVFLKKKK